MESPDAGRAWTWTDSGSCACTRGALLGSAPRKSSPEILEFWDFGGSVKKIQWLGGAFEISDVVFDGFYCGPRSVFRWPTRQDNLCLRCPLCRPGFEQPLCQPYLLHQLTVRRSAGLSWRLLPRPSRSGRLRDQCESHPHARRRARAAR